MENKLEQILVNKYPVLLTNYGGDPINTCMAFGFEHGDGWYKIIDNLLGYFTDLMGRKISAEYTKEYHDKYKDDEDFYTKYYSYKFLPPQITVDQIKEKYGTLRVYYHTNFNDIPEEEWANLDLKDFYKKMGKYQDAIDNAIDYAEYQSSVTCEITGKDGKYYDKGWCMVRCDEEAIKSGLDPKDGRHLRWLNA